MSKVDGKRAAAPGAEDSAVSDAPRAGCSPTSNGVLAGGTPTVGGAPEVEGAGKEATAAHSNAMRDAEPPQLPRPRMPLSQRAKIFVPFDPLKGYREALREKEREAEAAHRERIHIDDPA